MKDPRDIIKRPVVTEQSTDEMQNRVYTFEVDSNANKIEIAQAFEKIFTGSEVTRVNTLWVKPKSKRYGRHYGLTSKWKKAMVQLSADSKLPEFFSDMQ
jgi:large subunit ribosomal protein L23